MPIPVRFVVESGKLYVSTRTKAGKVRRIRSNPRVQLAPCTLRGKIVGPTVEAMARILPVQQEVVAKSALKRNYGLMMRIGNFISNLRGDSGGEVYLEIGPVREK